MDGKCIGIVTPEKEIDDFIDFQLALIRQFREDTKAVLKNIPDITKSGEKFNQWGQINFHSPLDDNQPKNTMDDKDGFIKRRAYMTWKIEGTVVSSQDQ